MAYSVLSRYHVFGNCSEKVGGKMSGDIVVGR